MYRESAIAYGQKSEQMANKVHIGKIIANRLEDQQTTVQSLAVKMDIPVPVLSSILSKEDIECNILYRISEALEYDFFRYYSFHLIHTISNEQIYIKKTLRRAEYVKARGK